MPVLRGKRVQIPRCRATVSEDISGRPLGMIIGNPDEDLGRTKQHPTLGTVTLAEMLHTWAAHDLNHTVQAERALMQPFMLGCGPWRTFFRDHEIGGQKE